MRTWWIITLAVALLAVTGCKEQKKAEAPAATAKTQPVPPATPKPEPSKPAPPTPKPTVKADPHYFLIAGCFEYKSNAERLVQKLQGEGFPDAKVLPYFENLYLVCYSGYPTRQEAVEALDKLRRDKGKADAWIHHIR